MTSFSEKKQKLRAALSQSGPAAVGLHRNTSNLFRSRTAKHQPGINLRHFDEVIDVDPSTGRINTEGMATYADLADAALARGCMPAVVPQLRSITIGGAAAGVGIESTSFRYGLVHHALLELEVLTGDGRILHCTPDNENSDLFFGFPNSYGTLGYALRVVCRAQRVKPYVQITHTDSREPGHFFDDMARLCESDVDFLDGTVFAGDELYITSGRFSDRAPFLSDYTYEHVYYRSIREREKDYLRTADFLWRWDTDWFWCSKNVLAQNPLVRRLYGRRRLNSITYQRIMRLNNRLGITRALERLRGLYSESVIQDIDIPIDRAHEFLEFLLRDIGILPIWICPVVTHVPVDRFPLYPMNPGKPYINFGFWDVIHTPTPHEPGHFNRLVERKVIELGGIKSLYSDSYFPEDEFRQQYGGDEYRRLKQKYDPEGTFPDVYQKCVLRA